MIFLSSEIIFPVIIFLRRGYGKKSVVHGLLEHLVEMFVIESLLFFLSRSSIF